MLYREFKIVVVLSIKKGFFFFSVKNRIVIYWLKVLLYMVDSDFIF